MGHYNFNEISEPPDKHLKILNSVLEIAPHKVKRVNVCCGLGFGKTTIGIQAAVLALNYDGKQRGIFFEPDWDRVNTIFWPEWERLVPAHLYTRDVGNNKIIWYNGSEMLVRPRLITASKARARGRYKGIEFTFAIDDETADGFDLEFYQNILARIRRASDIRFFLTLTTPLVGPYGRFIKMPNQQLFRGRTADNSENLPQNYETDLRATMSEQQARRELDGELTALEGRIWITADMSKAWPNGNRHDQFKRFNKDEPWWLFCDFGSAWGSYVVVQQTGARGLFEDAVWVAVADLCPSNDASASRAFQMLRQHFGTPAAIAGGIGLNTKDDGSGKTIAYFANEVWSNVRIHPCGESRGDKQIQFDRFNYLLCSSSGERRFTVARDFVSLDTQSARGVREMIDEDEWTPIDKRRANEFLPKGSDNVVQHTRDAILAGSSKIMAPPSWRHYGNPAA